MYSFSCFKKRRRRSPFMPYSARGESIQYKADGPDKKVQVTDRIRTCATSNSDSKSNLLKITNESDDACTICGTSRYENDEQREYRLEEQKTSRRKTS
ncbi:hypothetical protein J6590_010540 [Homalodisca vitripennis]|nr:hypothetical protein J6590_010540 [Homalodisca vitripennis]